MTLLSTVILYVLLIPGVALFLYYKKRAGGGAGTLMVVTKGFCTTIILAAGIIGLIASSCGEPVFGALIIAGIAMGLAGDIAICYDFLAGMVFFAIGHLCYISAFGLVSAGTLWGIPIFAALCLLLFVLYRISHLKFGKLFIPVVIYCAIISAMLSMAASIPIGAPGLLSGYIILAGAALFTASDAMLAVNTFGKARGRQMNRAIGDKLGGACLYCYFIGQSLFAVSIQLL